MRRQRAQRLLQGVRQLVEVGGVMRRLRTDEPRLLPKLLRQPMKRPHRHPRQLPDGGGQVLSQWPVEADQQDLESLRREAPRLLGGEQRLARARDAQHQGPALGGEQVEPAKLRRTQSDTCLIGRDVYGQR